MIPFSPLGHQQFTSFETVLEVDGGFFSALAQQEDSHALDEIHVEQNATVVIGGFLNLGPEDGWGDVRDDVRVGAAFLRMMLTDYFQQYCQTDECRSVMTRVVDCFENIGELMRSPFCKQQPEEGHRPKTNRARYDQGVKGWKGHVICRMVGNIATQYDPKKPFFEILVNSTRATPNSKACSPFHVTIYDHEKALDARRSLLAKHSMDKAEKAHPAYYSSSLKDPDAFEESTRLQFGPNAQRVINGLRFLNRVGLPAPRTDNCWIKQPMRCLLASLFLEILSMEKDLCFRGVWDKAKSIYKEIQKKSGIPIIKKLMRNVELSDQMKKSAHEKIKKRLSR